MAWCLALLQLWGCNVGIRPAADRSVAIRVMSLVRTPLGRAPKVWRETARLRRQIGIYSHL